MGHQQKLSKHQSLRSQMSMIVPRLLEKFLTWEGRVVSSARHLEDLHEMRLAGKRLRYTMELAVPAYGEEFERALERVKQVTLLMGEIHDCDVHISLLVEHAQEVRMLNKMIMTAKWRVQTREVTMLVRRLRSDRKRLYEQLRAELNRWRQEDVPRMIRMSCGG